MRNFAHRVGINSRVRHNKDPEIKRKTCSKSIPFPSEHKFDGHPEKPNHRTQSAWLVAFLFFFCQVASKQVVGNITKEMSEQRRESEDVQSGGQQFDIETLKKLMDTVEVKLRQNGM